MREATRRGLNVGLEFRVRNRRIVETIQSAIQ